MSLHRLHKLRVILLLTLTIVANVRSYANIDDRLWFTKAYAPAGTVSDCGPAVSMVRNGRTLAIGYPQISTVFVFQKDDYGRWMQLASIPNPNPVPNSIFGQSMCFAGNDLVINYYVLDSSPPQPSVSPTPPSNPSVYIYKPSTNQAYTLAQQISGVGFHIACDNSYLAATGEYTNRKNIKVYSRNELGVWNFEINLSWDSYGNFSNLAFVNGYLISVLSGKRQRMVWLDPNPTHFDTSYYKFLDKSIGLTDTPWPFNGLHAFSLNTTTTYENDACVILFTKLPLRGWIRVNTFPITTESVLGSDSPRNPEFGSVIRYWGNEVYGSDPLGGGDSAGAGDGAIQSVNVSNYYASLPFTETFKPVDERRWYQPIDESIQYTDSGVVLTWRYPAINHPEHNPSMMFGYAFDVNEKYLVAGAPRRRGLFGQSTWIPGCIYAFDRQSRQLLLWLDILGTDTSLFGSAIALDGDSFIIGSKSPFGRFHTLSLVNPLTVSLSTPTISAGQTASVTVQLSSPAPKGGLPCLVAGSSISSTAPYVLKDLPSTITIPEGKLTATFSVTTDYKLDIVNRIQIYADGYADGHVDVQIAAPRNILNFSATSTTLGAGETTTLSAKLDKAAPTGGLMFVLSDSANLLDGQRSIFVPAGKVDGSTTLTAKSIGTSTTTSVTLSSGIDTKAVGITVNPPALAGLTLGQLSVFGGASITGTVALSYDAPQGGLTINLSSNSPNATVPTTALIPAGVRSASFTIQTKIVPTLSVANISASLNGISKTASVSIKPPVALSGLTIAPTSVIGGSMSATGTITLTDSAPEGGVVVTLTSSKPAAATVPSTAVIPAGSQIGTFTVTTKAVASTSLVTISGKYLTVTKTANVSIEPPGRTVPLGSLKATPTVVCGGVICNLELKLRAPAPPEGIAIAIELSDKRLGTVPAIVHIDEGKLSTVFQVRTSEVTASQGLRVTAKSGSGSVTTDITLTPQPAVSSFVVSSSELRSNQNTTATLLLAYPAPSGGTWLSIALTDQAIESVNKVLVPEGHKSISVALHARSVSKKTSVSVQASTSGGAKKVKLTVIP